MDTILEIERFLLAGGIDTQVYKENESILVGGKMLISGRFCIPRLEYFVCLCFIRINVKSLLRLRSFLAGLECLVMFG